LPAVRARARIKGGGRDARAIQIGLGDAARQGHVVLVEGGIRTVRDRIRWTRRLGRRLGASLVFGVQQAAEFIARIVRHEYREWKKSRDESVKKSGE
jgi:hypothetical protein